ncbi:hypothetical protein OJJOAM_004058 [Cupriavidus sp. H18C1]
MAAAQRGQSIGAVLARVAAAADPHQRGVEQQQHGGQHLLARNAVALEIAARAAPQPRQCAAEREQTVVLVPRRAARSRPGGSGTACGRGRRGRWPGYGRGGRGRSRRPGKRGNRQRVDAGNGVAIADAGAVRREIGEAAAHQAPRDAGPGVVDIADPGRQRLARCNCSRRRGRRGGCCRGSRRRSCCHALSGWRRSAHRGSRLHPSRPARWPRRCGTVRRAACCDAGCDARRVVRRRLSRWHSDISPRRPPAHPAARAIACRKEPTWQCPPAVVHLGIGDLRSPLTGIAGHSKRPPRNRSPNRFLQTHQ